MDIREAVSIFKKISFKNCIRRSYMGCMGDGELESITKLQQYLNKGYIVARMSRKNGMLTVDASDPEGIKRVVVNDGDRQVVFTRLPDAADK